MENDNGAVIAPEEAKPSEEANAVLVAESGEKTDEVPKENRREEFDRLIRSEYKAEFDERVKRIIDRRFKETRALKEKAERAKPPSEALDGKGGEHVREILRDMSVRKTLEGWQSGAEALKAENPSFDLRMELRDSRFRDLLKAGVDMRTAYDCVHLNERLDVAVRMACERTRENTVSTIRARGFRPDENGAEGRGGRGVSPPDVSKMTRREREQIEKRCARGEKVYF